MEIDIWRTLEWATALSLLALLVIIVVASASILTAKECPPSCDKPATIDAYGDLVSGCVDPRENLNRKMGAT